MKHSGLQEEMSAKTLWVERVVYGLTLIVLLLAISFPAEARKIFYFACGLAGIGWALDRKRPDSGAFFLLAALASFALYRIVYAVMDAGTFFPEIDALQVYLSTSSRFLMGLLLIGYLSTRRSPFHERWFQALCITLILSLVITAGHEFFFQQERVERNPWATLFSYEAVAVGFAYLGLQLTRQINERKHWGLLAGVGLLTLGIILWTETRSALFCFFIGGALLLLLSERARKWKVLGAASLLMAVVLVGSYPYLIKPRLTEAYTDITQYVSGENRATSIGTRFELWRGSVMVLKQAPWGGGYWKRAEIIGEAVEQQRLDSVALHYSQVNMHNELLEELSLRGVVSGVLLLLVYFAAIALGWRARPRNLALLGVVFAYIFSGLTDVLFFSREATVLFIALLAVLIRSSPRQSEA
ncbi:MAG: O-antigen ligase family protein [Proteobacteria bacterium]|nr:O-antigen ligase family protein [Pseudomonadota bacterium]MCL2307234.1 O-antigen ligase family protein [Pseudomonadota bacterium]